MKNNNVTSNQFIITETRTHLIIENNNSDQLIKITKLHGHGSIKSKSSKSIGKIYRSYGILGLLKMNNKYLVSVSDAKIVGQIFTHKVYEIVDIHVISLNGGYDPEIEKIKGLIGKGLYFSDFPIFKRISKNGSKFAKFKNRSDDDFNNDENHEEDFDNGENHEEDFDNDDNEYNHDDLDNNFVNYFNNEIHDSDFIFNYNLLKNFNSIIRGNPKDFTLNCICGYFGNFNYGDFQVALISRRSWKFSGSRYNRRGANRNGDAANFVETEQVVYSPEKKCSFLITRGSIPLKWKQFPSFWYAPKIFLESDSEVLKIHYEKMIKRYEKVYFINLICSHGGESEICQVLNSELKSLNVPNFHFNFKKRKIAYLTSRREEFFEEISDKLDEFGFTGDFNQQGVMRINCIDSIDRTNMVQFLICHKIFEKQLKFLKINKKNDLPEFFFDKNFQQKYEKMWIKNGDAIAQQYTDTRALKSYALLNPRINIIYLIRDKIISLQRHYKCLFTHGRLQTSHDLLTGNNEFLKKSTFKKINPKFLPLIFALTIIVSFLLKNDLRKVFALWIGFVVFLSFGFQYFVDYPDFVVGD
ncbi:Phosphatidylinositide phosphatase SAC1 [Dictyocoela muelleri]|nr:Phosphatidylinositide phosphatase SAC1 [Dictyocoela muelleri]